MAIGVALALSTVAGQSAPGAGKASAAAPEWERISPNDKIYSFFTTRTGRLYAQANDGFWRSDGAGTIWTRVSDVIFGGEMVAVAGADGGTWLARSLSVRSDLVLHRTTDAGTTWNQV